MEQPPACGYHRNKPMSDIIMSIQFSNQASAVTLFGARTPS
jgi:hypothetical protein